MFGISCRNVGASLIILLSCFSCSYCRGSFWDTAGSFLKVFYQSVADDGLPDHDYNWENSQEVAHRILSALNSTDDVINLDTPDLMPLGWSDVFQAGAQLGQALMEAVDEGALDGVLPDLSAYGLDNSFVLKHASSWDWDQFTDDLLDLMGDGWKEDPYSKQIDDIRNLIDSYTTFEASEEAKAELPPECFMTVPQMIRFAGYPCGVYSTITKDGYKLTMHRIPFGSKEAEEENGRLQSFEDTGRRKSKGHRTRRGRSKRPVVFLQHGILSDSSCWVSNGPGRSLAFLLADAGFDVWMGNVRGNTYSRDHTTFNPDEDERYWRFTWQQMSEYDLPAMMDAVLRVTDQPNLYYVGHSQGTLIAFARLAEDPSFNLKIKMMFGLAPVATLGHIKSPVKSLAGLTDIARFGVSMFGGAEILPSTSLTKWLTAKLHKMSQEDPLAYHGHNLLLFLAGFNVKHYHRDRLPVFLAQTPSGTSLHNLIHMSQLVSSGKTQKWDYGSVEENLKMYGQLTPPEYDVSKITVPIILFFGSKDDLADPKDGRMLAANLRSMKHFRMISGWDHLDFLWGKDAPNILYPDIIEFIQEKEHERDRKLENIRNQGFRHLRGVDDEL